MPFSLIFRAALVCVQGEWEQTSEGGSGWGEGWGHWRDWRAQGGRGGGRDRPTSGVYDMCDSVVCPILKWNIICRHLLCNFVKLNLPFISLIHLFGSVTAKTENQQMFFFQFRTRALQSFSLRKDEWGINYQQANNQLIDKSKSFRSRDGFYILLFSSSKWK